MAKEKNRNACSIGLFDTSTESKRIIFLLLRAIYSGICNSHVSGYR